MRWFNKGKSNSGRYTAILKINFKPFIKILILEFPLNI